MAMWLWLIGAMVMMTLAGGFDQAAGKLDARDLSTLASALSIGALYCAFCAGRALK